MEGGKENSGRRRRAEPKQREMTVCLVRAAYYLEHSNLAPLGRLPVTSNEMDGGSQETELCCINCSLYFRINFYI